MFIRKGKHKVIVIDVVDNKDRDMVCEVVTKTLNALPVESVGVIDVSSLYTIYDDSMYIIYRGNIISELMFYWMFVLEMRKKSKHYFRQRG